MSVVIISQSHLLRDMLLSICQSNGFDTANSYEVVQKITSIDEDDLIVLHTDRENHDISRDVAELQRKQPLARIIILAAKSITEQITSKLRAAVEAIVPDDIAAKALIGVLSIVEEGYQVELNDHHTDKPLIARQPKPAVLNAIHHNTAIKNSIAIPSAQVALSKRETVIMNRLCDGASNKNIANSLGITEGTVKVHLRTCFRKIGVRNRTQAAIWAASHLNG